MSSSFTLAKVIAQLDGFKQVYMTDLAIHATENNEISDRKKKINVENVL